MPNISEDDESASDGHEPDEEAEDDDGEEEEEEEEEEEQPEGVILCSSVTKLKNASLKKPRNAFSISEESRSGRRTGLRRRIAPVERLEYTKPPSRK